MTSIDLENSKQGRWTPEEHNLFVKAINQFGREWDKVQAEVKTRSLSQVRSHAQKYFLKLSKMEEIQRLHEIERRKVFKSEEDNSDDLKNLLFYMNSILANLKKKKMELEEGKD